MQAKSIQRWYVRVHIGLCDIESELELEVEDSKVFAQEIEAALTEGVPIRWYVDTKGRTVGLPVQKIAFITIEADDSAMSVGFG